MPLVATYMFGGAACMPAGVGCFASGVLPACLTAAIWQPITGHSLGIFLVSRTGATAIFTNSNAIGLDGEMLAFYAHSIVQ